MSDIRMQGFHSRKPVDEVLAWIDTQATPLGGETVELSASHGRVLVRPVVSPVDVPAFDRSAMDGFALRAEETIGAGDYNPLSFSVIGASMPGLPFSGIVEHGQVVRIMTGAPIPDGADCVVPAEFATENSGLVEITEAVPPLKHIGHTGEDIQAGSTLLQAGHQLRPQD